MQRKLGSLCVLLLALCARSSAADDRTMALGADGRVFQVVAGSAGDLFPATPADKAECAVLAVDVFQAGKPAVRHLVPGTDDAAVEGSASLVYQKALDTVFLVWESRTNGIHSQFKLASLRGADWSLPISLRSDYWTQRSSPRIAVTTEHYRTVDQTGAVSNHQRTIVHTLWSEEAADGEQTLYSPVILIDGAYLGWSPVQILNDLDGSEDTAAFAIPGSFSRSPSVSPGHTRDSFILSFVNTTTGRLLNLEVEVLPWALTDLGARLRDYLAALNPTTAGSIQNIAEKARAHILISGVQDFNQKFLSSLANEVRARIASRTLAEGAAGLRSLADEARAHILISGVEISGRTLRGAGPDVLSLEVFPEEPLAGVAGEGDPVAVLQVRTAASFGVPRIGEGPTTILASTTGAAVLVAWEEGGQLRYRENFGSGWSDVRVLALGAGLSRERAYRFLEERIQAD